MAEDNSPKTIKYDAYWSNGRAMLLRRALPADHPEQEYNYVKRLFNVEPEDYGVFHPIVGDTARFDLMDKEELKVEVLKLLKENSSLRLELGSCYKYL